MKLVIKNGAVLTMNPKEKRVIYQDIVIEDDKITGLVDHFRGKADHVIDAEGKVVMPGLVNVHSHVGMSLFKATNDSLELQEWLEKKIWPIEGKMTSKEFYKATLLGMLEMLKTGTTCMNDMYIDTDAFALALQACGLRGVFGTGMLDIKGNGEEQLEYFKTTYEKYKNQERLYFTVAPHSFYTCSTDYLKECEKIASEYKLPIHVHFCENLEETKTICKNHDVKDPVDALEKVGFLNHKLILAHATFISNKGLEKLKNKDVSFVHCPFSNLNLGCGIADITKYKEYVNVCLGTDGAGSGNSYNLFQTMNLADLLQRGKYQDPRVISSYEVLKMATINGAKALGLDHMIGSIEVGKKADIIVVDLNQVSTYPISNLLVDLVHNVDTTNVDTVLVDGQILYEDKELMLPIDEEELFEDMEQIVYKYFKHN